MVTSIIFFLFFLFQISPVVLSMFVQDFPFYYLLIYFISTMTFAVIIFPLYFNKTSYILNFILRSMDADKKLYKIKRILFLLCITLGVAISFLSCIYTRKYFLSLVYAEEVLDTAIWTESDGVQLVVLASAVFFFSSLSFYRKSEHIYSLIHSSKSSLYPPLKQFTVEGLFGGLVAGYITTGVYEYHKTGGIVNTASFFLWRVPHKKIVDSTLEELKKVEVADRILANLKKKYPSVHEELLRDEQDYQKKE